MNENEHDQNEEHEENDEAEESAESESEESSEGDNGKSQKPRESDEARATRLLRQTNQARKKLGLAPLAESGQEEPAKKEEAKTETKPDGLDWGQKAFLAASDLKIKGKEEIALVQEYLDLGKSLDDIVENRHFQNDLKDLRDSRDSKAALPTNTKRGTGRTSDSVDYWLEKPFDQVPDNMKQKVLNARLDRERETSTFTKNPIISNG